MSNKKKEKDFKHKYPEIYKRLLELAEKCQSNYEELTDEERIEVIGLMEQLMANITRENGPIK